MTITVNAYCTHRDPPPLGFAHSLNSRRGRSDPELTEHLNGFIGFVMRTRPQMTAALYATLRHIERVQTQISFEVDPAVFDEMVGWAQQANAIFFMPDGAVLNPSGAVLVDPSGAPGTAAVPFPADAVLRKQSTDTALAERHIRVPASLPPVVGETEVQLRSAEDVARRALALMLVAVRAESLSAGEPLPVAELREKLSAGYDAASPAEHAFLSEEQPPEQSIVNSVWRYEALFVLAWALGLFDELPFPDRICDVPAVAKAFFDADRARLVSEARLRDASDILDALDLHYRLHWAARQAMQVEHKEPPAGLEPGVLQERHHALNWLTRFADAEWDDVDTPT